MTDKKFRKPTLIFMTLTFAALLSACRMFATPEPSDSAASITSLALAKANLSMKVGSMDYVAVSVKPANEQKNITLNWNYDKSIIRCDVDSAWGVTITALKEGQTSLRCSYGGYDSTCIITVSGFAENYEESVEPYIYSNTSILQTAPGVTEKVYVSLYGGSAADIDGYTWTCDNASVCSIQPTGQYCMITARDSGYARIKVSHKKAAYPYYIGIYVFADATAVPYITTGNNITTMRQNDTSQTIAVSLVNGKDSSLDSQFNWEIVSEGSSCPIGLEFNGNKAVITPIKGGSCTLRVSHPDAAYPLDILCRVLTIVKNVYIEPSDTVVTLSGDMTATVRCDLKNIDASDYDISAYEFALDDYNVAEIVSTVENQVTLKGKANGSCKLLVSHEKAAYAREVLLIANGQLSDAVDASCYITTSQNYIRTKVGAEGIPISISLKGGEDGDEAGFSWSIRSVAADGSNSRVIDMETANGTVVHASRMAAQNFAYGKAYMEPRAEGTAVITLTHPKVLYPTEILVKVLDRNAVLESPLYFTGNGLLKILNGESAEYTVQLRGENKASSDDNDIKWKCDDSRVRVSAVSNIANVSAPSLGSGSTVSNMTISHDKADMDKKVLVMTADDQDTLDSMKALYSDKLYHNVEVGEKAYCITESAGFGGVDGEGNWFEHDFSNAKWTVKDSSIVSVERGAYPLTGIVTGLKSGSTTVTCGVDGYSCEYTITVYPKGAVQTEPEVYFTTSQNVVSVSGAGKETTVHVSAINLSPSGYSNIAWENSEPGIISVIPNGTKATISALAEGESVISVSHPDSQNRLKIYVRVGSEYVMPDVKPMTYISSQDVLTMLRDDSLQRLDAVLVNYDGVNAAGFRFEIDDSSVATISSQSANGIAYIKPISSGQAEVTITHPATALMKKVLVLVGNSAEELAGITYLTTSSNVVAVGEGNTISVSVSVKNSDGVILDGYTWTSSAPAIVDVNASGASAIFTGNSIGTAVITVRNRHCQYPLEIIAQCVDPIAAAASPYIQLTSSVITANVGQGYTNVTADLVGGNEGDYSGFAWTSSDSSICAVYGQNEVGKIRALKAGTTYITVSHPKAMYSAQLLVVCDEVKESECYISVPASIVSMKPTDSTQSITASLINGTSTDKYNFSWSLDVYDVIDFVYSANVCTISPKSQGQCTITIRHPKAAYDQQVVVTVQEYSDFAFPNTNVTITQGDVKFYSMHIPNTNVATHLEYSSDNHSICTISGTKATAQVTAVGAGTTTVHAKLVASGTGVVQAESDMLIYVKEAEVNAVYITSASTIYTVSRGKSATLSAVLSGKGIANDDQHNLKWTTGDTDVVQIAGIKEDGTVRGQSIYVTALKGGEALITCSHEKAQSDLQFYVVVPGSAEKTVSLNKTYMTIVKGSSGSTLKATIENSESSNDYHDIEWSVQNVGDVEVCRVMGSGQTVTVYPVSVGQADIMAQLPNSPKSAKCTVVVEAGRSLQFEQSASTVQPFFNKEYKYTISPPNAQFTTWQKAQADDYFDVVDLGRDKNGVGRIRIDGIKEGNGTFIAVTDGGAKAQMAIRVDWNYSLKLDKESVFGSPDDRTVTFAYAVSPSNAEIHIDNQYEAYFSAVAGDGKISITPRKETPGTCVFTVRAVNPNDDGKVFASRKVSVNYVYASIAPKITLTNSDGNFSRYDEAANAIFIGDGENATFNFAVTNPKVEVRELQIVPNISSSNGVTCVPMDSSFSISGGKDVTANVYNVTEAYRPVYTVASVNRDDGKYTVAGGEAYTDIPDWKKSVKLSLSDISTGWGGCGCNKAFCGQVSHHPYTKGYVALNDQKYGRIVSYYCDTDDQGSVEISPGEMKASKNNSNTNIKRLKDTSLVREYSKDEFEGIAYWYSDAYFESDTHKNSSSGHTSQIKIKVAGINKNHVSAVFGPAKSTEPINRQLVGSVSITFKHGSATEKKNISVYLETRNCVKTQK